MKKITILIAVLTYLVLPVLCQGQSKEVGIVWGPEEKESKKTTLNDIVGYDKSGIFAYKTRSKGLYGFNSIIILEHFNQKLELTKSIEIELEYQKKEMNFEYFIHLNNNLYVFSSFTNQKSKKKYLFYQTIEKNTLSVNKDLKKVAEIDYDGNSKYNSGNFQYELSRDSSKLLVYYNTPFEKGEKEKFGLHVFNNKMEELWNKEITLPYIEELFEVEDYLVDIFGNVHVLGTLFNEKRKEKVKGEPNFQYQIISYSENGQKKNMYPVKIEGRFLTDMQIEINDNQELICGGFYSDEGTYSIKGSYFLKIDTDSKNILTKNFKEFDFEFITEGMTEREEKKAKKKEEQGKSVELYEYDLDDIILKDDGGAVLIGEQYFIRTVTHSHYDGNGGWYTSTSYHYNYNDIIVINISSDGKIIWNEKIAKKQVTSNDGGFYSSYALNVTEDKLHFVFNDNPKNLSEDLEEGKLYNFNRSRESVVALVTVDSEGNQKRKALFSSKESETLTRPKVCKQISEKNMILFGQEKKYHRFIKLIF